MRWSFKHCAGFNRFLFVVARIVAVMLFLLSSTLAASAQVTESEASDLAKKAVLTDLGESKDSFLAVYSAPSLQQLFAQILSEGHSPLPFVFHISNEGEEHLGNVTKYHVPSDFILDSLVAISISGEVYRIREGHNSQGELNRLAKDYHVKIESEEQAQKYLAWYLAVRPYLSLTEIHSAQQLKDEAEHTIKGWGKSPEEDNANFEAWWRKHERQANRLNYNEQVTRTDRGFLVSFYVLSDTDRKHLNRGPGILRVSMEFSANGEAASPALKKAD
jgi:hypothetical protein